MATRKPKEKPVSDYKITRKSPEPEIVETPSTVDEPEIVETTDPVEFEETTDGIEEVSKDPEPELDPEPDEDELVEEILPPEEPFEDDVILRLKEDILREVLETNETVRADYKADMEILQDRLKEILEIVEEKDEAIEILSTKNIDLINIDMELISDELYESEIRLNNIATIQQFERLNELENTKGINMAYRVSKLYLEHAGTEARLTIPILNLIKISLEKISEKLRYIGDEDV